MNLVDPGQGKAKQVLLVEHGETVVKSIQVNISNIDQSFEGVVALLDLGAVSIEWGTMFIQLIMILVYGFLIYFLVSTTKFMKQKTQNDQQIIEKLDELLNHMKKSSKE